MEKPYYYVLFRWWTQIDLERVQLELTNKYTFALLFTPRSIDAIKNRTDERCEIEVVADTLKVKLSPFRAVLYQEKKVPFTRNDIELREKIKEIFPRDRPTPFNWTYIEEPRTKYET
jgi:hypothetical protein